jgi:hypothetical protein
MIAYKEILTLDDPQTLVLSKPLPLPKGQRIEVVILATNEDADLEQVRTALAARGVSEADVREALAWAREKP